jgi:hypothetical protein
LNIFIIMSVTTKKLIAEGFVKVCTPPRGCQYVHPDGRRVKVFGNRVIKLKG